MVIHLGKSEHLYEKPKLKKWLELQVIENNLKDAVDNGNTDKVIETLFSYISTALNISVEDLHEIAWYEVATAFLSIYNLNSPNTKFKILHAKVSDTSVPFNYDDRMQYVWINLLASKYGWTIEYINDLDFDDAIALLQEILYNEQLDKEWDWVRSENAYVYNENTKKSDFKPLDRLEWMREIKEAKHEIPTRIKKSMLPMGEGIKYEPKI